jgi:hypothetical protein
MPVSTPVAALRPTELEPAVEALAADPGLRVLAGGTELMVLANAGRLRPSGFLLIDRIPELRGVWFTEQEIIVGAATTCADLTHADVRAVLPALAQAARAIGSAALRTRATLGGNLASGKRPGGGPSPAAGPRPADRADSAERGRGLPHRAVLAAGPGRRALRPRRRRAAAARRADHRHPAAARHRPAGLHEDRHPRRPGTPGAHPGAGGRPGEPAGRLRARRARPGGRAGGPRGPVAGTTWTGTRARSRTRATYQIFARLVAEGLLAPSTAGPAGASTSRIGRGLPAGRRRGVRPPGAGAGAAPSGWLEQVKQYQIKAEMMRARSVMERAERGLPQTPAVPRTGRGRRGARPGGRSA